MTHVKALAIKGIMTIIVLYLVLGLGFGFTFGDTLLMTLVLGLFLICWAIFMYCRDGII